jgi:hypothetical protein
MRQEREEVRESGLCMEINLEQPLKEYELGNWIPMQLQGEYKAREN